MRFSRVAVLAFLALPILAALRLPVAQGQVPLRAVANIDFSGKVKTVSANEIVAVDQDGNEQTFTIQGKDDRTINVAGGKAVINAPSTVVVTGVMKAADLKPGNVLRFKAELSRLGASEGEISEMELITGDDAKPGIEIEGDPEGKRYVPCIITAGFTRLTKNRLLVAAPPNDFTRKSALAFKVTEDCKVAISSDDYRRAGRDDEIVKLTGVKLSTGDQIVRELRIKLAEESAAETGSDTGGLSARYLKLSDDPKKPRDVRSRHFLLHTDISDRQAQILLDKLETMVNLVSRYFGRNAGGIIECYVVRDLKQWPQGVFDAMAMQKIARNEGVTVSSSLGRLRKSIVYSCDDHNTVQHEAIHAFCGLTFGSTGPTWYSEGFAELGAYWRAGDDSVKITPGVLRYLQNAPPKKLLDIVAAGQITGDSWQAYAWRWALCYLLANNPNYSGRFKALGVAMMEEQPGVTFEAVYGPVAKQISFEYDLFVKTLDNGYRADLAAWPWNEKFSALSETRPAKFQIKAEGGWQASGITIKQGESYEAACVGKWKIHPDGDELTGAGDSKGRGRMEAIVFNDFKLSEPIVIGARSTFTAPTDGQLYFRCNDAWGELTGNEGEITVWLRHAPATNGQ